MKRFIGAFLTFLFNDIITHIPVHIIRKGFLRMLNKKISSKAVILMHTRILGLWNIEIADRVVINQYCLLDCRRNKIIIDQDTDIGPYTRIWTLGHDPNSEMHELYGGDVVIKDHVWIASGVTILPGVSINRGAVVASASVVTKSVGEMEIVAGNPARKVKERMNSLGYKIGYHPLFD